MPLGSTNARTTSGVACHHHLWAAHTVERRQLWHASIALWQHTQSKDVGRGMTSSPLGSTHGRTTSGVACHNRLKAAHTVERCQAWHDITAFGQHTRSNDIGRDMPSRPLDSTHGRMASGVAFHRRPWNANQSNDVGRGMPSSPLGVSCYHLFSAAQTVRRCRAWHAITALGKHTWSDDVGRGMPSPPMDSRHGRTTSGVA